MFFFFLLLLFFLFLPLSLPLPQSVSFSSTLVLTPPSGVPHRKWTTPHHLKHNTSSIPPPPLSRLFEGIQKQWEPLYSLSLSVSPDTIRSHPPALKWPNSDLYLQQWKRQQALTSTGKHKHKTMCICAVPLIDQNTNIKMLRYRIEKFLIGPFISVWW